MVQLFRAGECLRHHAEFGKLSKRPIALHDLIDNGSSAFERMEIHVKIENGVHFQDQVLLYGRCVSVYCEIQSLI